MLAECDVSTALSEAGGLADTRSGRRSYRDYLEWLSAEDSERKRLGFEKMCPGWAKGSKDFKQAGLDDLKEGVSQKIVESEAKELCEPLWEQRLLALGNHSPVIFFITSAVFRIFSDFNFCDPDAIVGFFAYHRIKDFMKMLGNTFAGAVG